jgi:uncharacterized protein (DUF433 family)
MPMEGTQAMAARPDNHMLGRGVYTLTEVAHYTGLHANTVRSWFKERSDRRGRGPILQADYGAVGRDFAVSFWDLIDAYVVGQLRSEGVKMRTVREAYDVLKSHLSTEHPFAHSDIYTDGRRVFTLASEAIGDERLTEVVTGQHFFSQIKDLLKHVDYDEATRLARQWSISPGVVINPAISYGKPVVKGTGVTTFVVSRAYQANHEDAALVADLYRVDEDDVHNAVRFEEEHGWRRAA